MLTFDLTKGKQTTAGLNGHPDELRIVVDEEAALRVALNALNLLSWLQHKKPGETLNLKLFGTLGKESG